MKFDYDAWLLKDLDASFGDDSELTEADREWLRREAEADAHWARVDG